jgi:hypothetical protein
MAELLPRELADVLRAKLRSLKRRVVMSAFSKEAIDVIRLQMLYNISNGWSWYAYKRLGPEKIIELELEMWDELLPPAVEKLLPLVEQTGSSMARARSLLDFICQVSCYEPRYTSETERSLTWEYRTCPNWDSLVSMNLEDYVTENGRPAKVSCIHGCTRVHEIYFRSIDPAITVRSLANRPQADQTCRFRIELSGGAAD